MTTSHHTDDDQMHTEVLLSIDPTTLLLGANVRTDTRPDAKDFAASIKCRGVLEAITAYRDDDGHLIVLRGQRRALVAAQVGTPTDTEPVRVVAAAIDADRITDQLIENLHRAAMHDHEVLGGVEQLVLIGISAAQITKRTSLPRGKVEAALAMSRSEATRQRVLAEGLTLEEASAFAEFEHDAAALELLEQALTWGGSLEHTTQRLRDEAAERAALMVECVRLREEGLPVLAPEDVPATSYNLRMADMCIADGEPVPEAEWPNIPGAAVIVERQWQRSDASDGGGDAEGNDDETGDESDDFVEVLVAVWLCLDPEAAGLQHRWAAATRRTTAPGAEAEPSETARQRQREERRRVIPNNEAWDSAETVRRQWLAQFLRPKTVPSDAEVFVAEALITGHHSLEKAMQARHPRLRALIPHTVPDQDDGYGSGHAACARLLHRAQTAKAATLLSLGVVLAAWEDTTGRHNWRNPSEWDQHVMAFLFACGYQPSEVEQLLLPADPTEVVTDPEPDRD